MSRITVKDGTTIYYKDWGKGHSHHVLTRMATECGRMGRTMLFLAQNGFRAVALDRLGHGRSSQA